MDPTLFAPLLAIPAFAAVWLLVGFLLATVSGWRALAARFEDRDVGGATRLRPVSGWIGWVRFNNALAIDLDARGIRFALWLPFLAGFRPFRIDWTEFESITEVSGLFRRVKLVPREGASIQLTGRVVDAVLAASRGAPMRADEVADGDLQPKILIAVAIGIVLAVTIIAIAALADR